MVINYYLGLGLKPIVFQLQDKVLICLPKISQYGELFEKVSHNQLIL